MSFDYNYGLWNVTKDRVSIPFEQGDVFRRKKGNGASTTYLSQSLSSRAMSFDNKNKEVPFYLSAVSIPFEQGDVFRRKSY